MSDNFVKHVENLLEEAFQSMSSAKMNEDFLESASKAFREIPNFIDAFKPQETDVDSTDSS